jgi:opacity protein-like surface antigen
MKEVAMNKFVAILFVSVIFIAVNSSISFAESLEADAEREKAMEDTLQLASAAGRAETQGRNKVSVSIDQEILFNRDMELENGLYWNIPSGRTIGYTEEIDPLYSTMAKVSYGVLDNLDIYLRLGTSDYNSKCSYAETGTVGGVPTGDDVGTIEINGENAFAWAIGAKGAYNLTKSWILGCDIQYLRHENDLKVNDSWTQYNVDGSVWGTGSDDYTGKVTFQEWHVAPYVALKLGNFVPYIGGKYSDLRTDYKLDWPPDNNKPEFKADHNFGVFLGTDYKIGKNFSINLEGRFVDETAMSFGATYGF